MSVEQVPGATDGAVEEGAYSAGLISLPDGRVYGIEDVVRFEIQCADPSASPADLLGAARSVLGAAQALPFPFRLAASTMRAGLGAFERGLRKSDSWVPVSFTFSDGTAVTASMPSGAALLIHRDAELVRGVMARIREPHLSLPPGAEEEAEALTSIFRYERRNGRLRRVTATETKRGR